METARLAQSVERKALNLVVVGSSPTVGVFFCHFLPFPGPIRPETDLILLLLQFLGPTIQFMG